MLTSTYPVRIEWGACDAAGITFYPNYFRWFDAAAWHLFEKAGFDAGVLLRTQGVMLPIVDVHARFRRPGWLGDELLIDSRVSEWSERFFRVSHVVHGAGGAILEGEELRCWAVVDPRDGRRIRALAIPTSFREAIEAGAPAAQGSGSVK